jgi:hypothetical protein
VIHPVSYDDLTRYVWFMPPGMMLVTRSMGFVTPVMMIVTRFVKFMIPGVMFKAYGMTIWTPASRHDV